MFQTLQEGDILMEINGTSVRQMSHSEVVQVLKDCPRGQEASITIQRGHTVAGSSPSKNKYKSKKEEMFKPKSGFLFRSASNHRETLKELLVFYTKCIMTNLFLA